jgi:hypothetical protein
MDIEQALEQVNWNSSKDVIKFYESNNLYFSNKKVDADLSISYELLDIKTAYFNALDNEGHYSKA